MRSPAAHWDVFLGVAPRCREEGTKDAVDELWSAWVDLDSPNAGERLASFELRPSIVVASGTPGHLHAYWPLRYLGRQARAELPVRIPPLDPLLHGAYFNAVERSPLHCGLLAGLRDYYG